MYHKEISLLTNIRSVVHQLLLIALWRVARFIPYSNQSAKYSRSRFRASIALVPSDTENLIGARGDEAMMNAVVSTIRNNVADPEITVACSGQRAITVSSERGFRALPVWGGPLMPLKFLESIRELKPTIGLVIGADIMDGHYSPVLSLRMLIAADLLALCGAKTSFVGFSLNDSPALAVRYAFHRLDARVRVNLRDPISWRRYEKVSGRNGRLVADSAFLLKPAIELSPLSAQAIAWMQQRRSTGRRVLILNLHPMLFSPDKVAAAMPKLMASMTQAVSALTDKHALSWLLLPHDNRPTSGDMTTLAALEERMNASLREQVYFVKEPPSAAEIKTIAKYADGAVTGRMHLAIAALGQSTPVMAFAYQDKFAGLLQHFCMPEWLVLDAESATDSGYLIEQVERFVNELPVLRAEVEKHLPAVTAAANATFDGLFQE